VFASDEELSSPEREEGYGYTVKEAIENLLEQSGIE